jgi:hypothetical protein
MNWVANRGENGCDKKVGAIRKHEAEHVVQDERVRYHLLPWFQF